MNSTATIVAITPKEPVTAEDAASTVFTICGSDSRSSVGHRCAAASPRSLPLKGDWPLPELPCALPKGKGSLRDWALLFRAKMALPPCGVGFNFANSAA